MLAIFAVVVMVVVDWMLRGSVQDVIYDLQGSEMHN